MRKIQTIYGILVSAVCMMVIHVQAQNPKAKSGTFALTNATIETVTKGTINGTVVISNGKITAVGSNITIPAGAEVINCSGMRIYPGMIDSGTKIGLLEVGAIPQASDERENGELIPQMKALTAVNPNSTMIPVTRISGVTTAITYPEGGLVPGTAALINLFGYTPDQMYAGFEGVVVNFPNTGRRGNFDRRSDDDIKKAVEKSLKQLNDLWDKAVQYHKLDSATKGKGVTYYPEMIAMVPVVRGAVPLLIEVNTQKDIQSALKWVKEKKVKKVVFTGVAEGWREAENIAKANIPVITGPVIGLPTRSSDKYDAAYANASMMKTAGVKVALRSNDDGNGNYRNLPYHAGFAATYGMTREDALKAITIVPAEMFGVGDKLGSIEVGKVANLFVCNGDIFETKTQVSHVFISGFQIPMQSRQTLLYDEFLKREPGVVEKKEEIKGGKIDVGKN
ncbi:MAG TPA: amidohydrolase family protein [Cyclobacteriaceae bacterium]|nr:amidohydrolase family protein [Cyclobacteriaceae bacterium]